MPDITVITPANSTALTLLATVKQEIAVTTTTDDAFIGSLIQQATDAITDYCQRTFAREVVSEGLPSYGKNTLMLSLTPVVNIAQLTDTSSLVDATDYYLQNPVAGI